MRRTRLFIWAAALLLCSTSHGQQKKYPGFYDEMNNQVTIDSSAILHISQIHITGNDRTKEYIILRELKIHTGDSIIAGNIFDVLEESNHLIYNTSLFSEVEIRPILLSAYDVRIEILLKERWYIYPAPQFKLVDRNFNEWWKTYNADLNRVIYGVKFLHYNLSGRSDQLRIYLLNGYARTFYISYTAPYSNKKLNEGYSIGIGFTQNREFPYKTDYNNGLVLYKTNLFDRSSVTFNASYATRNGYFKRNYFSFQFNYIKVNDTLISEKYNPNYFNTAKSRISFPDFSYSFVYNKTDNINYPLIGKNYALSISKRGLGISGGMNMLALDASFKQYFSHKSGLYSNIQLYGKVKLPFHQSYLNQRALGYSTFYLRGLEYYVIDGVAAALAKYTVSKKLVSFRIPIPFHIKAFPYIPFTFFAKTFADGGFCYNQKAFDTRLNNRLLYSGGGGIDLLTLYDINLSLEYSFNQLGEKGLFLHLKGSL
jgi:hypothetical protein